MKRGKCRKKYQTDTLIHGDGKARRCLRCLNYFPSNAPGNRICKRCEELSAQERFDLRENLMMEDE